MKHFLLSLLTLITLATQAQTTPPSIAMLVKLYTDSSTAAVNDYAHQLGFKGEPFGFSDVGNTYDYMHYTFASKDTLTKQHTYLSYTWGEHQPMFSYRFVKVEYGTNSKAEFDTLVAEIRATGATIEDYGKPLPGNYYFKYKNTAISACTNLVNVNGVKYSITVGGGYW